MKTSNIHIMLADHWDDFKRGVKWRHEQRLSLIFYPIWMSINALYVYLIYTASIPFLRWFNITIAVIVNIFLITSTIHSGRHAKRMEELQEANRELFDIFLNDVLNFPAYTMPPLETWVIEPTEISEDIPDEDF